MTRISHLYVFKRRACGRRRDQILATHLVESEGKLVGLIRNTPIFNVLKNMEYGKYVLLIKNNHLSNSKNKSTYSVEVVPGMAIFTPGQKRSKNYKCIAILN